jgi:hypothetical protein
MDLKQFDELLHDAEVKLKRLKALYEQWFQGIERIEPLIARKDLDRALNILAREKPRNTAARFRLQQLNARYAIYITYWGRISRQIEEGSFERVPVAKRAIKKEQQRLAKKKAYELDLEEEIDLESEDLGHDEIASTLSQLESPALPVQPPKAAFSVFSPFAFGAKKQPAAAAAPLPGKATDKPRESRPPAKAASPPSVAPQPAKPVVIPRPLAHAEPLELDMDEAPPPPKPKGAAPAVPKPVVAPAAPVPKPIAAPPARAPAAAVPKPVSATFGKPKPSAPRPAEPRDEMRHLYDEFVAARRRNNEQADVAYDKMSDSIQKMRDRLREKHGDKKIGFEVVVQDGKVGLKPKIG